MTDWDHSIDIIRRGHEVFGGDNGPAPSLGVPRITSADHSNTGSEQRAEQAARRLYAAAENDQALMRLLREVAAAHQDGRRATGNVLDIARSDRLPAADTPMGQREAARRMVGYLRDQRRHLLHHRAASHAFATKAHRYRYTAASRPGGGVAGLSHQSSPLQVATAIVAEAHRRGYSREQAIAILCDAMQESGLRPGAAGGGGAWHGIFQQDTSYPGRDDPNRNINEFFNRLDTKGGPASPNIWKSIFWLQQRPGEASAEAAYLHGRRAYLTEIQSQLGAARRMYREITA